MNAIGGYFGLELKMLSEYHRDAIRLNTGRNAFEYILKAKRYKKVYVPFYTCDVMLQPINRLNLKHEFYFINDLLEPVFDFKRLKSKEAFLYTNYFGLKDKYISELKEQCDNLIIDNAQAFFSLPHKGVDTFYSPRKYFGVADGAYLYTDKYLEEDIDQDLSHNRFEHLLKRIDSSAEDGYKSFLQNDKSLNNAPVMHMSNLTRSILQSIDYSEVALRRRRNYHFLNYHLGNINQIKLEFSDNQVPMVYPFLTSDPNLRQRLINNHIYTATYWPNVLNWVNEEKIEYQLVQKMVHLPIDQRYCESEMKKIIESIKA